VETAAGSGAGGETISGLTEYELVRDFLYERMRGGTSKAGNAAASGAVGSESLQVLGEIRDALRDVRAAISKGGTP